MDNIKVCLDLDDFSVVNNRLDLLLKLKEHYSNFKVSLFTVPIDQKMDWGAYQSRADFLSIIKELDWIQIIPHGLTHNGSEMKHCDYKTFKEVTMPAIQDAFDRDGLSFEKGFKAPHWRWSEGVVRALDEAGWWGATDPRQKLLSTKRFYSYSQSIDEPLDLNVEVLKLHGHIYGTRNDLGKCFYNLLKIPQSAEWCFITDFISNK